MKLGSFALGPPIEVYQISMELSNRACQKFGHGVRVVEQDKSISRPLGGAQRVQLWRKVDLKWSKWTKIDIPPLYFKNRKISQNLVIKHLFLTC